MPTISGVNYPGPFEIELTYDVDLVTHVTRFNCIVTSDPTIGDDFTTFSFETKSGGTVQADVAIDALVAVLKTQIDSTDDIINATLWKYVSGSFEKNFVSDYSINISGTGGGGSKLAYADIYTFRTTQGGISKLYVSEPVNAGSLSQPYTNATTAQKALMDYLVGSTSWVIGRDNGFLFSSLKVSNSQHEKLYEKRYRPNY